MKASVVIEKAPSRKIDSQLVTYYVKDSQTRETLCKFTSETKSVDEIEGITNLNIAAQLEIKNYLTNIHFATNRLQMNPRELAIYRIMVPTGLQQEMIALAEKAKQYGVNYDPNLAMLNGLINHTHAVNKKLVEKGEASIWDNLGINPNDIVVGHVKSSRLQKKYAKKLFKQMLEQHNAFSTYNQLAKEVFNKDSALNTSTIHYYANGEKKVSNWSLACCIITLSILGHSFDDSLDKSILAKLIYEPLRHNLIINNTEEAKAFAINYLNSDSALLKFFIELSKGSKET